jgi:hypothetical protein
MAEAVGLALSIAPLIVSAAEHYSTAAKVFKRYKLYSLKREELVFKIKFQRAIFKRTLWRLLAYDVGLGEDEASQMLADAGHSGWSDAETTAYFEQRMAEVRDELMESIHMINNQLALLNLDPPAAPSGPTLHGADVVQNNNGGAAHTTVAPQDGAYASRKTKSRFAVSEDRLREGVGNLRILTEDFRTLVDQTAPPHGRAAVARPTSTTSAKVAKYAAVKAAATDLYQALGLACTKHTAHQAHISLKPSYGNSSQIRFTIAFRQTIPVAEGRRPCHDPSSPMWLTVESQVNGTIQTPEGSKLLDDMRASLKRPAESRADPPPCAKPKKLIKKSVKFNLTNSQAPAIPLDIVSNNPSHPTPPPMQNLCAHSNFCNQLQHILGQPLSGSSNCIGYLECSGQSKHLVYTKSKTHSVFPNSPEILLRPLREVYNLTKQGTNPSNFIPLPQKISLAKELAIAVLQFHATPWLLNSICSDDVLLPGTNEVTSITSKSTHEPYVDVSIKGPHGPLARQTTFPSRTLIRNRLLFSLGVMMLELAYQVPLQSLQKDRDVDANVPPNTDYHIANRVTLQAAGLMGPKYVEVVRKCIQCDFGHGDDLGQTKLQEGFHQDVICKLEELEETFRGLSLAI